MNERGRSKRIQGWILDGEHERHRCVDTTLRLSAPNVRLEFEGLHQQMRADANQVGFAIFQDDNVRAIILENEMFFNPEVADRDGMALQGDDGRCLAEEGIDRKSAGSYSLVFQWPKAKEIYVKVTDTADISYSIRMDDSSTTIEVEGDDGPQTIHLSMDDIR